MKKTYFYCRVDPAPPDPGQSHHPDRKHPPAHREVGRSSWWTGSPEPGKAVRLGITGVPGVGKSTFIESFGMMLVEKGDQVAVLAVDPSSTRSGGSILADKTRMERLAVADGAFIRPSPSGGTLGGSLPHDPGTLLLCEAAGFDVVIVETVGVGQSETTVASMVDFFWSSCWPVPETNFRASKKGCWSWPTRWPSTRPTATMRKSGQSPQGAYELALHLLNPATPTWSPPVLTCSAVTMAGLSTIWETVLDHREKLERTGELAESVATRPCLDVVPIEDGLKDRFHGMPGSAARSRVVNALRASGEISDNWPGAAPFFA
jgi:LAO/AO transport system kinase